MTLRLSPTQSRLAAILLLVIALALVIVLLAWPTWSLHRHYDSAISESVELLERYGRVAAIKPAVEQAIDQFKKDDNRTTLYWQGSSQALAASEMQAVVGRIVESNNARVFSSQILQPPNESKPTNEPAKVLLTIQLTASTVPLQLLLHAIESNRPYLFVDRLTIRANQGRGYKAVPGQQPEFTVQMTLRGYFLAKGQSS